MAGRSISQDGSPPSPAARAASGARPCALCTAPGMRVAIGDLDGDLARELAARARATARSGLELDVTRRASFAAFLDDAEAALGDLDVLVNNAGIMALGRFVDEDDETARRMVDINVHGVLLGMKLALPRMTARDRGHVVNLASRRGPLRRARAARPTRRRSTPSSARPRPCAASCATRARSVRLSYVLPYLVDTELGRGTTTTARTFRHPAPGGRGRRDRRRGPPTGASTCGSRGTPARCTASPPRRRARCMEVVTRVLRSRSRARGAGRRGPPRLRASVPRGERGAARHRRPERLHAGRRARRARGRRGRRARQRPHGLRPLRHRPRHARLAPARPRLVRRRTTRPVPGPFTACRGRPVPSCTRTWTTTGSTGSSTRARTPPPRATPASTTPAWPPGCASAGVDAVTVVGLATDYCVRNDRPRRAPRGLRRHGRHRGHARRSTCRPGDGERALDGDPRRGRGRELTWSHRPLGRKWGYCPS